MICNNQKSRLFENVAKNAKTTNDKMNSNVNEMQPKSSSFIWSVKYDQKYNVAEKRCPNPVIKSLLCM